ncbi:energy transducer TonB [Luteibacter aegosomaticola]|uniref:energy transducer TonB n=1 Tax=Luteibacter aegosomaticola TaxID=2911538 RepID=UPI001FF79136|nr:energy transducer TonB [Luteibacter aegosomaticola]UPG91966.1 energy transducer TonB [Luteibacter aegosomaticola]
MKTARNGAALAVALALCAPAAATTVSLDQITTYCEGRAHANAMAYDARDRGIPLDSVLKQIKATVDDRATRAETIQITQDAYAATELSSYVNFHDVEMKRCVAQKKPELPMDDAAPTVLWRTPVRFPIGRNGNPHLGTVTVAVHLGTDSTVTEAKVARSSGFQDLDRAARQQAERWEYRTRIAGGQFYESDMLVPFTFGGSGVSQPIPMGIGASP